MKTRQERHQTIRNPARITLGMKIVCIWEQLLLLWRRLGAYSNSVTWELIFWWLYLRETCEPNEIFSSATNCTAQFQWFAVVEILQTTFTLTKVLDFGLLEAVACSGKFPSLLLSQHALKPQDTETPSCTVASPPPVHCEVSVASIWFVPSANSELFSMHLILLERPMSPFSNRSRW